MSDHLNDYYEALERLKSGIPIRIPKGSKISFNNVALEAGRGAGSIKKSRPVYSELRELISIEAKKQGCSKNSDKIRAQRNKAETEKYRRLYEQALGHELSLAYELFELKKFIRKSSSENVIPIR